MKFLILCGHGQEASNYDPGAGGCGFTEATETIKYGNLIAKHLRTFPNTQVDVYEGDMYHRLFGMGGSYDFTPYDYVLECHLNAAANPSGHGTEIFVTTYEEGITVEQSVMKHLSKYYTLRDNDAVFDGVKRYNWGVINAIKSQDKVSAALLELCFITNQSDMNIYKTKQDAICKDIAEGIAEGFGLIASGNTVKVPDNAPVAKPDNAPKQKSFDEIVKEVMNGKWGNDPVRKQKLTAAGYDAAAIQAEVNKRMSQGSPKPNTPTPSPARKSINTLALECINGDWGNDPERSKKLAAAGYDPIAVQARINEIYYG